MSWLAPGDKILHRSDWGHNHLLGDGTPESDEYWAKVMRQHMERHQGPEPPIPQGWHRFVDFPA